MYLGSSYSWLGWESTETYGSTIFRTPGARVVCVCVDVMVDGGK